MPRVKPNGLDAFRGISENRPYRAQLTARKSTSPDAHNKVDILKHYTAGVPKSTKGQTEQKVYFTGS